MNDRPWEGIFEELKIYDHDFDEAPFFIRADQIKQATRGFTETSQREVRILCKQDSREERPKVFIENNLFILPVRNGEYAIIKGEGYVDIPPISTAPERYVSKLPFKLETSQVGNSEMQHVDYAYATSLLRSFLEDETLVLTIRGRKYAPNFSFRVNKNTIKVAGVQTEVDAGYEGKNQVVLIEAKSTYRNNIIIRQLFYPYRQWKTHTKKKVNTILFRKNQDVYFLWEFVFVDPEDYNSIMLLRSACYEIIL